MSDLPQEAVEAATAAVAHYERSHGGYETGIYADPETVAETAVRSFLDASDYVSLADVTRGMGSTSCNCRSQIEERFGKSAPSVTPEGEQR